MPPHGRIVSYSFKVHFQKIALNLLDILWKFTKYVFSCANVHMYSTGYQTNKQHIKTAVTKKSNRSWKSSQTCFV